MADDLLQFSGTAAALHFFLDHAACRIEGGGVSSSNRRRRNRYRQRAMPGCGWLTAHSTSHRSQKQGVGNNFERGKFQARTDEACGLAATNLTLGTQAILHRSSGTGPQTMRWESKCGLSWPVCGPLPLTDAKGRGGEGQVTQTKAVSGRTICDAPVYTGHGSVDAL